MKLTAQQLKQAEEWAGLLYSPKEIAIIMELDMSAFESEFADESSAVHLAVMRGKLRSEGEIRKSIISLAKDGSASAQEQAMKLVDKYNFL